MKGIYTVDKSGRLTLGKAFVGKIFELSVANDGSIRLIPGRFVADETWLYKNKEALASVKRGMAQASRGEGKPLPFDLKDDEKWLNNDRENNNAVPTIISTRSNQKSRGSQKKGASRSQKK